MLVKRQSRINHPLQREFKTCQHNGVFRLTALAVDSSPLFVQMCITSTTSTGTLTLQRRDGWPDLFLMTLRMIFRGCTQMRELLLSSRMEDVRNRLLQSHPILSNTCLSITTFGSHRWKACAKDAVCSVNRVKVVKRTPQLELCLGNSRFLVQFVKPLQS
jgi:hypothetical protein